MRMKQVGGQLTVTLEGELDHHTAADVREQLEDAMDGIDTLLLDLRQLSFMDSSGIGVVLGRFRKMQEKGGRLLVCCKGRVAQILELAGVFEIVERVEEEM